MSTNDFFEIKLPSDSVLAASYVIAGWNDRLTKPHLQVDRSRPEFTFSVRPDAMSTVSRILETAEAHGGGLAASALSMRRGIAQASEQGFGATRNSFNSER